MVIDLSTQYFGNSIQQYLIFLACILLSLILGKIAFFIFRSIFKKITEKTKTEFDDMLLEIIELPVILAIIFIGFFIAYHQLNIPDSIANTFKAITVNLMIIAGALFLMKLLNKLIEKYLLPLTKKTKSDLDDHLVPLLSKVVNITIIILVVVLILHNLGYNVTSLVAGLGIGGLAVALAAQEMLKNFFGGIAILTDKMFKIGDSVEIDKYTGTVTEIGLRSTRLRTVTGELVTIPNSMLTSTAAINTTLVPGKRIAFQLGLSYGTSSEKIAKAKSIIKKLIENTDYVMKNSCDINLIRFNTYSMDLDVRFTLDIKPGLDINTIKDSINLRIKKEFEKEKISFAVPPYMSMSS